MRHLLLEFWWQGHDLWRCLGLYRTCGLPDVPEAASSEIRCASVGYLLCHSQPQAKPEAHRDSYREAGLETKVFFMLRNWVFWTLCSKKKLFWILAIYKINRPDLSVFAHDTEYQKVVFVCKWFLVAKKKKNLAEWDFKYSELHF